MDLTKRRDQPRENKFDLVVKFDSTKKSFITVHDKSLHSKARINDGNGAPAPKIMKKEDVAGIADPFDETKQESLTQEISVSSLETGKRSVRLFGEGEDAEVVIDVVEIDDDDDDDDEVVEVEVDEEEEDVGEEEEVDVGEDKAVIEALDGEEEEVELGEEEEKEDKEDGEVEDDGEADDEGDGE